MAWRGRLASLGVVGVVLLNIEDVLVPSIGLPLLAVAVALAWRFSRGFWRTVGFGLAGGAIAGVLIMGPGFRIAMRVVAIMETTRGPEFSVGGTMFIIIGIGGILGGIFGMVGNLIRKAVPLRSTIIAGLTLAGLVMAMLLSEPDLRVEFFGLGGGPWVNIPMFGLFAAGYGIAAMTFAERTQRQATGRSAAVTEADKVPA